MLLERLELSTGFQSLFTIAPKSRVSRPQLTLLAGDLKELHTETQAFLNFEPYITGPENLPWMFAKYILTLNGQNKSKNSNLSIQKSNISKTLFNKLLKEAGLKPWADLPISAMTKALNAMLVSYLDGRDASPSEEESVTKQLSIMVKKAAENYKVSSKSLSPSAFALLLSQISSLWYPDLSHEEGEKKLVSSVEASSKDNGGNSNSLRKQLLKALGESEVVNLLALVHNPLGQIYSAYCSNSSKMEFRSFLQLYTDFEVFPDIISRARL